MIPYCGWNKNSGNNMEATGDYDFLEINEAFSKKEETKKEEDESDEISVPPL